MPTRIEWCNALPGYRGETWSPVLGCSPVSAGCQNCYAARMASRGLCAAHKGLAKAGRWTGEVRWNDRGKMLDWVEPRFVFVCSMSDLFYERVALNMQFSILNMMAWRPQHVFALLTKRPKTMRAVLGCWVRESPAYAPDGVIPRNWWLGVSACDQRTAYERVPELLCIPAAVRFVSVEPMLGPVELEGEHLSVLRPLKRPGDAPVIQRGLDWVICGAETGPGARLMDLAWARDLRDQCQAAGVPFFFKRDSQGHRVLDATLRGWEQMPEVVHE